LALQKCSPKGKNKWPWRKERMGHYLSLSLFLFPSREERNGERGGIGEKETETERADRELTLNN